MQFRIAKLPVPFLAGLTGLIASNILLMAVFPLAVLNGIAGVPFIFGWFARKSFDLSEFETVFTAFAIPALPASIIRIYFPQGVHFLGAAIVGWFFFSLLGWYLAMRFGSMNSFNEEGRRTSG